MKIILNYEVDRLNLEASPKIATLSVRTTTKQYIALSFRPELLAQLKHQIDIAQSRMPLPTQPQQNTDADVIKPLPEAAE